jgi:hypothetical protein
MLCVNRLAFHVVANSHLNSLNEGKGKVKSITEVSDSQVKPRLWKKNR